MELVIIESPFAGANTPVKIVSELGGFTATYTLCGVPMSVGPWASEEPAIKCAKRHAAREYARAAMRDCLLRGEAPYASHLLYTQDGVLDDDTPDERALGIEAGLCWGAAASKTVVYIDLGISDGMAEGIQRAKREGRPIEQRTLPGWS